MGNITVGGTGKTPVVIALAEQLIQRGIKVAVLSRGYRSLAEKKKWIQATLSHSTEEIGDEPYFILHKLPQITCYVSKDRKEAAKQAEKEVDVLLLDDGLQYRKLQVDFTIITRGCLSPQQERYFLPLGRLRDLPKRLQEAEVMIYFQKKETLKKNEITASLMLEGIYTHPEGEKVKAFSYTKVAAFCGISQPNRWIHFLQKHGLEVVDHLFLADHEPLSLDKLQAFAKKAKSRGAMALFCTEKDQVKLPSSIACPLPIFYGKVKLYLDQGASLWQEFIEKIVSKVNNSPQN